MRKTGLDGIRGWAAIAVAIYHSIIPGGGMPLVINILNPPFSDIHGAYNLATKSALMIFNGYVAVSLFFVLSGCVLIDSLNRSTDSLFGTSWKFVVRRVLRIYPLLVAAVLFVVVMFAGLHHFWPAIFPHLKHTVILNNMTLYDSELIGATWTLQSEILAIPYFLACFILARQFGPIVYLLSAVYGFVAYTNPALVLQNHILSQTLIFFSLGMLIPTSIGKQIVATWGPTRWPLALLIMIATRQIFGAASLPAIFAQAIGTFIFVAVVYYGAPPLLSKFLNSKPSQFIGKLSYSFYLFCCPVLMALIELLDVMPEWHRPLEFGFFTSVAVIGSGIILACFTERLIERPSIELGKRLTAQSGMATQIPNLATDFLLSPPRADLPVRTVRSHADAA
jgi:peptidoglycan/LPS O-acetylase OafA/YrhL